MAKSRLLRFAIPPSLGAGKASRIGERLQAFLAAQLSPRAEVEVVVAESYPALGQHLLKGTADAGWAPPLVCARVEAHGGRAVARAVRGGASSFRAALVCRRDKPLDPARLLGLSAAWVDRDSTAGYLLPQAWVRSRGLDPYKVFVRERFVGSFRAAAEEVASGKADVTATFASAPSATRAILGIDDLPRALRDRLKVFAFTGESPNDAVVVGPAVSDLAGKDLARRLLAASDEPEGKKLLAEVFDAERFEPAPKDGYRVLYNLVLSTLR